MTRRSSKPPSQRQLRVGEEMRHVLATFLGRGELRDPVLKEASITVTEVRVSPDMKNATVFVMPLTGSGAEEVLEALRRAAPFLRGQVGREMALRYTPQLRFELDRSFDEAARIEAMLRSPRVQQDLAQPDDGESGDEAPGEQDSDDKNPDDKSTDGR